MSTNTDFRKSMNVSLDPKTMELITKKNKLSKRVEVLNDIEGRLNELRQHVGDGILTNSAKYISEDDKEEIRKIRNELPGEYIKKDDGYLKQIDKLLDKVKKQKNILRKRLSYFNKIHETKNKNKLSKRVQELNNIEERLNKLRQYVGDGILTNSAKYISEDDKEAIRKIRNELPGEYIKKDDGYLKQIEDLLNKITTQKKWLETRIRYINKLLEQRGVDPGISCSFYYNEELEQ